MLFLKYVVFLFVIASSILCAEDFPKYRMVDLGLFGTDQSSAIAINENGQVLGTCKEGACNFIFLWDALTGLKLIDLPDDYRSWELKLNNKCQIVGTSYSEFIYRVFLWDPSLGFWELESSKNSIEVAAFNDMGQVLEQVGDQIFLLDHGKKTNLTVLFKEQVPGNWSSFHAVSLNNHGHVAFNAYKSNASEYDTFGQRSFLWKDGQFKMIMPEKGWETSTQVGCLDDEGNIIVNLYHPQRGGNHSQYFISQSRNISTECQGCELIRNGLPVGRDCIPGKLKKDSQGKWYFSKGLQIKKLFIEEFPYYNVSNTTEVRDQNSKGHVIGHIGTMFPGDHAFLAIPETQNE